MKYAAVVPDEQVAGCPVVSVGDFWSCGSAIEVPEQTSTRLFVEVADALGERGVDEQGVSSAGGHNPKGSL